MWGEPTSPHLTVASSGPHGNAVPERSPFFAEIMAASSLDSVVLAGTDFTGKHAWVNLLTNCVCTSLIL